MKKSIILELWRQYFHVLGFTQEKYLRLTAGTDLLTVSFLTGVCGPCHPSQSC